MFTLVLAIAALFSPFAAGMAFVITYHEDSRHRLPRREILRRSAHAAIVTLLFFLGCGAAIGWLLSRFTAASLGT